MRRIGGAIATFVAYSLLLSPLGFVAATSGAFAGLALLFGGRPIRSAAAGLGFALTLWVLFVHGLGLPLPIGTLFR